MKKLIKLKNMVAKFKKLKNLISWKAEKISGKIEKYNGKLGGKIEKIEK